MLPLAFPPYTPDNASLSSSHHSTPYLDPAMRSLLASTWQVLQEPPPPSLREILGAYKSKGDGDRDMLLAMLNAKSSEDQRIASTASLHRAMIEIHQPPPPHLPQLHMPNGMDRGSSTSPPQHPSSLPQHHQRDAGPSHFQPSSSSSSHLHPHHHNQQQQSQHRRTHSKQSQQLQHSERSSEASSSRKRARTSQSPSAPQSPSQLPPSPFSTASSRHSATSDNSQSHSRDAMAIGSLISSGSRKERQSRSDDSQPGPSGWNSGQKSREHHRSATNSPRTERGEEEPRDTGRSN